MGYRVESSMLHYVESDLRNFMSAIIESYAEHMDIPVRSIAAVGGRLHEAVCRMRNNVEKGCDYEEELYLVFTEGEGRNGDVFLVTPQYLNKKHKYYRFDLRAFEYEFPNKHRLYSAELIDEDICCVLCRNTKCEHNYGRPEYRCSRYAMYKCGLDPAMYIFNCWRGYSPVTGEDYGEMQ